MTGAFFDLDNTLVRKSTGLLWYQYLRKNGHVSRFASVKMLYAYIRYRMNSLDIKSLAEREVRKVAGMRETKLIEMCQRWFHEMVKQHISPRAREAVNEHKARGHVVAILSAATPYTVEPVKDYLDIGHGICTHLVVRDGRLTGEIVEPYCYGEGKIYWAEKFAREQGLRLQECYFYTDSFTDLPMLERVGNPIAVNADRMLEAEARKRGWPLLKF